MRSWLTPSITHPFTGARARLAQGLGLLLTPLLGVVLAASAQAQSGDRELFVEAWESARAGDRSVFEAAGPQLTGYLLYPYWQYEDYRARRSRVPAAEMAAFLDAHEDWAFTAGLKKAWLKSLGKRGRWADLLAYGSESRDTEIRCQVARARIETGATEGLLPEVQGLWTVGRSQHDACDPAFEWLQSVDGITRDVAWERIRLAMREGNPRFTRYLSRFLPPADREWLTRWQDLNRTRYRRLDRTGSWPDNDLTRRSMA